MADPIDRLCGEVDRLRAKVDHLQRASTPMGMLEQIREAVGPEAAQRAKDGAGGWVGLVVEVDRLRDENDALAAALEDIAGMVLYDGADGVATGECAHMDCGTCWEHEPDDPAEWCPVCVAEVAWCAWKMGVLR